MVQIPYLLPRLVNGHVNLVLSLDTVSNGSSSLASFSHCRLAFQLKSAAPNHDFDLCDHTCVMDCFCFQEDGSCECMPTVWMALVQYSLDNIAYDVENVCITYEQQEVITKSLSCAGRSGDRSFVYIPLLFIDCIQLYSCGVHLTWLFFLCSLMLIFYLPS